MASSKVPEHVLSSLRILLVEDENLVALLLEEMLAELGHTVVGPVARLKKGLEMAKSQIVDLAILDVNLDGEKTYAIADALAGRGIPFVFSTGYGKESLGVPYCNRPTLQKPFQQEELERLLSEVFPQQTASNNKISDCGEQNTDSRDYCA
jgi:CheY-like chemotaxis protein